MTDITSHFTASLVKLKEKIADMEINAQTIMTVARFSMEVVETTELKGDEQKELAVKLIRQVVVEAPISDNKEKLLLDMIDQGILGYTIDLIVASSKGELDINVVVTAATGCCAVFLKK
uniref:Uncharacterized protein n=1 Tax=viral metagenome TaxID=1070528 RepID=A0A6C0C727_9ZZZZ